MNANPAPPAEVAPAQVKWGDVLARLKVDVDRCEMWRAVLLHDLADEKMPAKQRALVQAAIAQHERSAEIYATAWRVIWSVRSDRQMLRRLEEITAAERSSDDSDQVRYE